MRTFTLQVRVFTKFGQHFSDTVYYPATNWTQAIAKAKMLPQCQCAMARSSITPLRYAMARYPT